MINIVILLVKNFRSIKNNSQKQHQLVEDSEIYQLGDNLTDIYL